MVVLDFPQLTPVRTPRFIDSNDLPLRIFDLFN